MMYYDTRPSVFCGAFDLYTCEKLKGYYPLYWYSMFYDMEKEIPASTSVDDVYALCGVDRDGKAIVQVTYYTDEDDASNKDVGIDLGREGSFEVYLLDADHDAELVATTDKLEFNMKPLTALLI